MISLVVIVVIYGAGIFAPIVVAPYSYLTQDLDRPQEGPGLVQFKLLGGGLPVPKSFDLSADHWLGTDRLGRDMLSRVIYSARTTVVVTVTVILSGSLVARQRAGAALRLSRGLGGLA